ncbi:phage tail protein [Sphingomonas sp. So64.6b]|uniref:phage tail protein n=1 Tax=Sphingomonas sp. So64.6b TaxID=2997354 RepID=UPI00160010CA|nr:tail fiber protein [Sphingomonas sp. So64.6b]QNA82827.1 phage tail protein [Sphingomonas sp. So64.6b]
MTPYLGEIRLFGGYFAPANWHLCDGSLLSIADYDTLFSLLGTTYGGDGQTTFALPDLRGRFPIGQGQGAGLSPHFVGEMAGTEQVTLLQTQMPAHSHSLVAQAATGNTASPSANSLAQPADGDLLYLNPTGLTPNDVTLPVDVVQPAGGNQPHNNQMPTLTATYIISLAGIYPSRN